MESRFVNATKTAALSLWWYTSANAGDNDAHERLVCKNSAAAPVSSGFAVTKMFYSTQNSQKHIYLHILVKHRQWDHGRPEQPTPTRVSHAHLHCAWLRFSTARPRCHRPKTHTTMSGVRASRFAHFACAIFHFETETGSQRRRPRRRRRRQRRQRPRRVARVFTPAYARSHAHPSGLNDRGELCVCVCVCARAHEHADMRQARVQMCTGHASSGPRNSRCPCARAVLCSALFVPSRARVPPFDLWLGDRVARGWLAGWRARVHAP